MIKLMTGDVLRCLAKLPDESVQCVCTSPPYWGLRDYGVDGQIGLEPTPEAFVAKMVAVFREVKRILRDDGTCWVNLGDSYATQSPIRERNQVGYGSRPKDHPLSPKPADIGLKQKDLVGIPWRVAFALQADGWFLRSDIIWHKPNPMPESVRDRPTKSHEYIFLLTKRSRYYYDADAVREPHKEARAFLGKAAKSIYRGAISGGADNRYAPGPCGYGQPEAGRNSRSVWTITPKPFKGAHFATFPPALVERCVKAGTSERGACPTCGAPWERMVEPTAEYQKMLEAQRGAGDWFPRVNGYKDSTEGNKSNTRRNGNTGTCAAYQTLDWRPTCTCHGHFETIEPDPEDTYARPTRIYVPDGPQPEPVPCVVLDPFSGAGTVALVARQLGRDAIGIDLNPAYNRMARKRIAAV